MIEKIDFSMLCHCEWKPNKLGLPDKKGVFVDGDVRSHLC